MQLRKKSSSESKKRYWLAIELLECRMQTGPLTSNSAASKHGKRSAAYRSNGLRPG